MKALRSKLTIVVQISTSLSAKLPEKGAFVATCWVSSFFRKEKTALTTFYFSNFTALLFLSEAIRKSRSWKSGLT
jgi:hypothetical protein